MPNLDFGRFNGRTIDDVIDYLYRVERSINYLLNGQIASDNAFEFGGYRVSDDTFAAKSGAVGLSSAGSASTSVRIWAGSTSLTNAPFQVWEDGTIKSTKGFIGGFTIGTNQLTDTAGSMGFDSTVTGGNDLRMWAGSTTPATAPFRVYEDGSVYGSNFTLEGGVIRTAASGARIELSNNSLKTYNSSEQLNGFQSGLTPSGTAYGDAFFYSAGVEALRIYNTVTNGYSIFPMNGFSMRLGTTGTTTFANGSWQFSSGETATFLGTVALGSATVTGLTTDAASSHNHGIPDGTVLMVNGGGTVTFSSGGSHSHNVS